MTDTGPMTSVWSSSPSASAPKNSDGARGAGGAISASHISSSVQAIGWNDVDDDREERQPDHDHEERQVAEPLALGHAIAM